MLAVIRAPLRTGASATITAAHRALTMRLRFGKAPAEAGIPIGCSETAAPDSRILPYRPRLPAGEGRSRPLPSTAAVAPPASRAPS